MDGLEFFEKLYGYDYLEKADDPESEVVPRSWGLINTLATLASFRNWFTLL